MSNFFDEGIFEMEMLDNQEVEEVETEEYNTEEYDTSSEVDELLEEVSNKKPGYSLSKQEKNVVTEAMLRLEQARLYEMLLKHNFFDGVRLNPVAKQNVEQELKKFILDRLEILLGIKQDVQPIVSSEVTVDLPFNSIEIEFLKALAYKGTNGASISSEPVQAQATIKPMIKSLPKQKSQQEGLKPLVQSKPTVKKQPLKNQPVSQPVRQPEKKQTLEKQQQNVVQNNKTNTTKKKSKTLEEIAKEDLERMRNRKPVHEMTAKELMAANKRIEGGGNRQRPQEAIPMPSPEQQITSVMAQRSNISNSTNDFHSILSKALGAVPIETIADD